MKAIWSIVVLVIALLAAIQLWSEGQYLISIATPTISACIVYALFTKKGVR